MKLVSIDYQGADRRGRPDFLFWCPGCKCSHGVWVSSANGHTGATWGFNGNMDLPTFTPSILCRSGNESGPTVCHSFVRDGRIEYLGDCTHDLRGQTVEMVDWEDLTLA